MQNEEGSQEGQEAGKAALGEQEAGKAAWGEQEAGKAALGEQEAGKAALGEQEAGKAALGEQESAAVHERCEDCHPHPPARSSQTGAAEGHQGDVKDRTNACKLDGAGVRS